MNENKMDYKYVLRKLNNKEFVYTSVAQIIYIIESVVQNKIFTACFATNVYGKWSLILSIYTLISMLPFTALDQGINRVASRCKSSGKEHLLYSIITTIYTGFFVFYAIILVLLDIVQKEDFFADGCLLAFILYTITEIYKNTFILIDNAYRNRKRTMFLRMFELLSRAVLLLVLYYIDFFTIENVLIVLFVTNLIMIIYQQIYYKAVPIKNNSNDIRIITKDICVFSLPLMTWAIFGWLQNMISRWYLDALLDLESVAMYSVLTALSYFVPSAIYTIFSAYVTPIVFEKNEAFTYGKLFKYMACVGGLEALYVLFVCIFGKYIILILTTSSYLEILDYLPYTTITASLYVLSMLSTVEIFRRNQTKKLLFSTIMPGFLMSTVGYLLIRNYGFDGAVINYMMGHIAYTILTSIVVFNKKNVGDSR